MSTSLRKFMINFLCCFASSVNAEISGAFDMLTPSQMIRDGESLVSASGMFELGYFSCNELELGCLSSAETPKRYLGIWFRKIATKTVVWVANRVTPFTDLSGVLKVTSQGTLILQDRNGTGLVVWSSNSSAAASNPVAQLLDSGNLVVRDDMDENNTRNFIWQSFDYPTDTLLAEMKLGTNRTTGFDRYLASWKRTDDPSPGNFTAKLDPMGYPQIFIRHGSEDIYSTGPWNGVLFSGMLYLNPNPYYKYEMVLNNEEIYFHYVLLNKAVIFRLYLSPNGLVQSLMWTDQTQEWGLYLNSVIDNCDTYALCGAYSSCNIHEFPTCICLNGFVPKFPQEWENLDWSNGCVRRIPLECETDKFLKYSDVRLPDTRRSLYNSSMNLKECKACCKQNCSCTAYSSLDIRGGGSGCLMWFDELVNVRDYDTNGQDLYIRMPATESDLMKSEQSKRKLVLGLVPAVAVLLLASGLTVYVLQKKKSNQFKGEISWSQRAMNPEVRNALELMVPLFDLATLAAATNNFSLKNKLGQGGYGPVYKGILPNGQEIAVKKLSTNSRQGLDEFKNEIIYIAKLQHRNLVKLLGCCIEDENMLIYEYMPNRSLDSFLFDQTLGTRLDWSKRFHIINGIARGLVYLHQDSRLRIIHRDLKASNILLDYDMNPKISDFGLAKSFGGDETEANTNRIVGTHGYISPEYATDGTFSIKSDVFSFGVLVLEAVSGHKNRRFHHPDHNHNLLGHAWKLFTEGRAMELLDQSVGNSYNESEVLRSIAVGLLCVQRSPEDRPSMSKVVLMLESDNELLLPKEPGFFNERNPMEEISSSHHPSTNNVLTVTLPSAR